MGFWNTFTPGQKWAALAVGGLVVVATGGAAAYVIVTADVLMVTASPLLFIAGKGQAVAAVAAVVTVAKAV